MGPAGESLFFLFLGSECFSKKFGNFSQETPETLFQTEGNPVLTVLPHENKATSKPVAVGLLFGHAVALLPSAVHTAELQPRTGPGEGGGDCPSAFPRKPVTAPFANVTLGLFRNIETQAGEIPHTHSAGSTPAGGWWQLAMNQFYWRLIRKKKKP